MQKPKELVRIANTDIGGTKTVVYGLTKIFGVGYNLSNAICSLSNIEKTKKIGLLEEKEIKEIEDKLENPEKIPSWLKNQRKEIETGKDNHVTGPNLKLRKEFDIRRLKKIKSYKGMRHAAGLPVRGQKTKGHFRKSGKAVGVIKKAQKVQKAAKGAKSTKKK